VRLAGPNGEREDREEGTKRSKLRQCWYSVGITTHTSAGS